MKGYVYCIRSHQTDLVYIGSTTQILCKRMSDHRTQYKSWLKNNKGSNITSYEIVKYDDCYIELIEEGIFESKLALRAREGHYQRTMECVNKRIECQTPTEYNEYHKEYHTEHKQEINQRIKKKYTENKEIKEKKIQYYGDNKERIGQYYDDNKAHILERQNVKVVCECGCEVSKVNLPAHKKSKKHCVLIKKKC
jgi:hypothetical protein